MEWKVDMGEKKKGNPNQEFLSDYTSPVFVHLFMKDFYLRLEDWMSLSLTAETAESYSLHPTNRHSVCVREVQ